MYRGIPRTKTSVRKFIWGDSIHKKSRYRYSEEDGKEKQIGKTSGDGLKIRIAWKTSGETLGFVRGFQVLKLKKYIVVRSLLNFTNHLDHRLIFIRNAGNFFEWIILIETDQFLCISTFNYHITPTDSFNRSSDNVTGEVNQHFPAYGVFGNIRIFWELSNQITGEIADSFSMDLCTKSV